MPEEPLNYDLPWLGRYSGESTEELLGLEGRYRIDSIVVALREGILDKKQRLGHQALAPQELAILGVTALETAVNNDGYDGFFAYESEYAPTILKALAWIKASTAFEITQEALAVICQNEPTTPETIQESLDLWDARTDRWEASRERLEACDSRYYAEVGDLALPLFRFALKHRNTIRIIEQG